MIVTTKSETAKAETAIKLGCQDYTTKPIHGPALLAKVRTLIGD